MLEVYSQIKHVVGKKLIQFVGCVMVLVVKREVFILLWKRSCHFSKNKF